MLTVKYLECVIVRKPTVHLLTYKNWVSTSQEMALLHRKYRLVMLFREISDIVRIVGNRNWPTLCRQTQSTVFKHLLHVMATLLQRIT